MNTVQGYADGKSRAVYIPRGAPAGGVYTAIGLIRQLTEMEEAWPVYLDPRNGRFNIFSGPELVYLGWYGPGITEKELKDDAAFVLENRHA